MVNENSKYIFSNLSDINKLEQMFQSMESITKFNTNAQNESNTLAYSFAEIEKTLHMLINNFNSLKKLSFENNEKEVEDILHDIGEDFRHILYHIHDSKYYGYLFEK